MRFDLSMKISVIGLGFVGLSLASVLSSNGRNVCGIDIDKEKCKMINSGVPPFFEPGLRDALRSGLKKKLMIGDFELIEDSDIIFVTVGTPQKDNGKINLSIIKNATKSIGKFLKDTKKKPLVFIKSTVVPGTTKDIILPILEKTSGKKAGKDFGLFSNPEFLQESNAIKNTKEPHAVILGSEKTKFLLDAKRFLNKIHSNVDIITTNLQTAELIKYANNSFLATKISFINQIANICQNIPDANVDDVARAIGLDPRIGKLFLNAGPGYGGSCLPKDMKALINFAEEVGAKPLLLNAVEKINHDQINNIIHLMKKNLGNIKDKKISILGTAFKPNTDDIRDSIAVELIKKLLKLRVKVSIHDPKAMKNTEKIFGNKIIYAKSINDAIQKSNCLVIMTQWKEYEKIDNKVIHHMKNKLVIDCRRILNKKKIDGKYYAIGIGSL